MVVIPEMFEESGCFDPSNMQGGEMAEDGFSNTTTNCNNPSFSIEGQYSFNHESHNSSLQDAAAAVDLEFQQRFNLEMEQCFNNQNSNIINQSSEDHMVHPEMGSQKMNHQQDIEPNSKSPFLNYYHQEEESGNKNLIYLPCPADIDNMQQQSLNNGSLPDTPYPPTPDLFNMFPLPRCSASTLLLNSSISFPNSAQNSSFLTSLGLIGDLPPADGASAPGVVYDPLLPLNLPPQPPMLRDLFHSLPHGYNLGGGSGSGSLFSGVDDGDVNGGLYHDGDGGAYTTNGVFEFTAVKGKDGKDTKHFATERQRRVHFNDKYKALRSLVPNPTKNDRASIVGDAIEYINELKMTVRDLKILVEKRRCSRERIKRHKTEDGVEFSEVKTEETDQPFNGSGLRSSWLHRKSKNTEVDVRIIDDEVTVKLVQQKRINCLLHVSKVLDEFQLDLHHVAGGLIGDYYSFLFNSKIYEGSSVYAHAIANKLIDVVDTQYAAIPPTNSY